MWDPRKLEIFNQVTTKNKQTTVKITNTFKNKPPEIKAWFRGFLPHPARKWIIAYSAAPRDHKTTYIVQ